MCSKTPFGPEADLFGGHLDKPVWDNGAQKQKPNKEERASELDWIGFKYYQTIL